MVGNLEIIVKKNGEDGWNLIMIGILYKGLCDLEQFEVGCIFEDIELIYVLD